MSKFQLDYEKLDNHIYKRSYKLSEVQDRLERVAFDIVKFKDGDQASNLWQIQSSDDGEYIVSLYQSDEENVKTASADLWDVMVSKATGDIQISYKGEPLVKIASNKLGIPKNEIDAVIEYLPSKLAENTKLVKALLNELSDSAKNKVLSKYPELVNI